MIQFRCWISGFTFAALLTIGGTAEADPVRITSGFLTVGGAQDFFSRGFLRSISYDFLTESFRLQGADGDGVVQNVFSPTLVIPSQWTPTGGSTTLVNWAHTLVFTATPGSTVTPFQLSGGLSIFDRSSGATLFSDAVSGSGTASWRFVPLPSGSPVVSGVTYQFQDVAPTPEPGTFMLIAAGLGAIAAHRRKRMIR